MIGLNKIGLNQVQLNRLRLNAPFPAYGKMAGGGGSGDGFPVLPGDVTRWHFGGLTNEMMAAMDDPRIEDADHKGRFLSFKNFAWGGMSGVGGYTENYNSNRWYKVETRIDATWTYKSFNARSIKDNIAAQLFYQSKSSDTGFRVLSCTIKVSGLTDGQGIEYVYNGTQQFVIMRIENDGIYHLPSFDFGAKNAYYGFRFLKLQESCNITIEQLPLYPGALVFDGVDDWAGCDNLPLLPKEKGYSIIALRNWITRYDATQYKRPLISNLDTNDEGAFLIEYRKDENVNDVTGSYNSFTDVYIDDNNPITWQTSSSYNGQIIKKGTSKSTNKLSICKTYFGQLSNYANAAIWEIVILDHDATEEELTKIKDYFIKTYPWLFPDQAWTVVGKTNEDEDRATIANITGNGNDLVCLNLGFIEGSGYNEEGEYAGYLVTDGVDDKITSSTFEMGNDWTVIGDWELINTGKNNNAGIVKFDSIVIYNYNPILINIKNGRNNLIPDQNTVNAICSDGRIYSKDWKESIYNEETESTSKNLLTIGYSGNSYTKIAFKNLAIYPTVLSKEDCIKAYNYLQTLKAK